MDLPEFLTRHEKGEIRLTGHRIDRSRAAYQPGPGIVRIRDLMKERAPSREPSRTMPIALVLDENARPGILPVGIGGIFNAGVADGATPAFASSRSVLAASASDRCREGIGRRIPDWESRIDR